MIKYNVRIFSDFIKFLFTPFSSHGYLNQKIEYNDKLNIFV